MKPERRLAADEVDAFCRWCRRHLCCLQRPGVVHKTKQAYSRRIRRSVKQRLANGDEP